MICGTELSLTVVTRDHLDNACTRGGAAVDVGVEGGERGQSVQSRVTDHKDGTYAIAFRLPEPGIWRLAVYLNNAVMECSQVRRLSLHASVRRHVEHTRVICSFATPRADQPSSTFNSLTHPGFIYFFAWPQSSWSSPPRTAPWWPGRWCCRVGAWTSW